MDRGLHELCLLSVKMASNLYRDSLGCLHMGQGHLTAQFSECVFVIRLCMALFGFVERGWGNGSVEKMFASQMCRLQFRSLKAM